jgi:hypothetical protein
MLKNKYWAWIDLQFPRCSEREAVIWLLRFPRLFGRGNI